MKMYNKRKKVKDKPKVSNPKATIADLDVVRRAAVESRNVEGGNLGWKKKKTMTTSSTRITST